MTDRPEELHDLDAVTGGAETTTNTHRVDPYKNFKFQVATDGQATAFDGKFLTARDLKRDQTY